ncbi:LmbU family transcriptional regulator [Streptosporangium sp. NPDC001559]|uniref:LmbU family transcriptional regulator n=1 Tax=Streptosporangium sp. NPDC001559 TaxID=3366187 RepID=UPI0036E65FE1
MTLGEKAVRGLYSKQRHEGLLERQIGAESGVHTNQSSLTLPARLPIEEWMHIGQKLNSLNDSVTWWLGDWLVYGQDRYPERYLKAVEETSLDYQTLRNYAWIARKFPPGRRCSDLSMQHHAEVAALTPASQRFWLERAQRGGWSRNELRRRIRSAAIPNAENRLSVSELRLKVSKARRSTWEDAAKFANSNLAEWMVEILDAAARNYVEGQKEHDRPQQSEHPGQPVPRRPAADPHF